MSRRLAGATGHRAGEAAEAIVAAHYVRTGCVPVATRWRGAAGEIDLVLRRGAEVIFVEVKKSRSFARAAERVSPRQAQRLLQAAAEFLGGEPLGQATPMRFDVALVDGTGRVEIIENALGP
jgi:putative endonuclease